MNNRDRIHRPHVTRRAFVRAAVAASASLALGGWWSGDGGVRSTAGPTVRLLVLTDTGPVSAETAGVRFGVDEARHAAKLFGGSVELVELPWSGGDSTALARQLNGGSGFSAVIGGGPDCVAARTAAEQHGVLYMNTDCDADEFRNSCSRLTFSLAPSAAMERDALAEWMKTDAGGWATEGADATSASRGEERASVAAWDPTLTRYGASQLNDRFMEANDGKPFTSPAWLGWMAVKVVWESALRAGSGEPAAIAEYLSRDNTQFDGHKGISLSFRSWNHQLRQPVYVLVHTGAGESRMVATLPTAPRGSDESSRELLDTLGAAGPENTKCE